MSKYLQKFFPTLLRPSARKSNYSAELHSLDQLISKAEEISLTYSETSPSKKGVNFKINFKRNVASLKTAYFSLSDFAHSGKFLAAGSEWILDNFHVIDQIIRGIQRDLPRGYYKALPKISEGPLSGHARSYLVAEGYLSSTDSAFNSQTFDAYISKFQERTPFDLGEVWSFPIMLRLVVIEHLQQLSGELLKSCIERQYVDAIIEKLFIGDNVTTSAQIVTILNRELSNSKRPLKDLAPVLLRKLRALGSVSSLAIQWIEEEVSLSGETLENISLAHNQEQASRQISIGNCITSLKLISRFDWKTWVEDASVLNSMLMTDPVGSFSVCDFNTRDLVRQSVEKLSRSSGVRELDIAKHILECCKKETDNPLTQHISYHCIDEGKEDLLKTFPTQNGIDSFFHSFFRDHTLRIYLGAIAVVTVLIPLLALFLSNSVNWSYKLAALALLIPASQFATDFVQFLFGKFVPIRQLAKLDLKAGIGPENQTTVVVQSIVSSQSHLRETISHLEVCALANATKNVHFGILADLPDSTEGRQAGDQGLIALGRELIEQLNTRLSDTGSHFFIFFRAREYNSSENKCIGWERKRGKIEEFNALLGGAKNTSFNYIFGDLGILKKTQFVVTLDNDTNLPVNSVKELIACAAHPLNRATLQKEGPFWKVARGYTIIQPRVSTALESAHSTIFSRLFSGQAGLDPYTLSVSDTYQDAFNEASYIGKGIYDVDAFRKLLSQQLPENSILSHDLLESAYVHCGLSSDIELFDENPSHFLLKSKRNHRWIRGDWQLLPWIFPRVPLNDKGSRKSPFSALARWKLIDNLRRSLVPAASVLTLAAVANTSSCWVWLVLLTLCLQSSILFSLYSLFTEIPLGYSISIYFGNQFAEILRALGRGFYNLATLPYQCFISLDAIIRTLFRVFISRKNLLEWETAHDATKSNSSSLAFAYRRMSTGTSLISLYFIAISLFSTLGVGACGWTLLFIWSLSPVLVWVTGRELGSKQETLEENDQLYLRKIAKETWNYFDENLLEDYNYLIPDNIQEAPQTVTAERTSPTNISLSLLATISAYDLGFISLIRSEFLISKVLESVDSLEKHQGHLFNWYAIRDKRPLSPRYISSVDSGNLVGHLSTLSESLEEFSFSPYITDQLLHDTLNKLSPGTKVEDSLAKIELLLHHLVEDSEQTRSLLGDRIFNDLQSLLPHLKWILKIEVLENLANQNLIPKKLNRFRQILSGRKITPSLVAKVSNRILSHKERILSIETNETDQNSIIAFIEEVSNSAAVVDKFFESVRLGVSTSRKLVNATDFSYLYDKKSKLLSIGYNVDIDKMDDSFYDLLASEARLASFCAIVKKDIPAEHWFMLGRSLTETYGRKSLLSWSGTMFEYLMPTLIMKDFKNTLLSKTYSSVVAIQRRYAERRGIPWGISESAFGTVDFENTYQYRAFGVPGLGLKRGLVDDLVVSPYSTALALLISPLAAIDNFKSLEKIGARGIYGYFEAIDFTVERLVEGETFHVIRSFFAHHQGMSLVSINNALNDNIMPKRFHNSPSVRAFELLLQERFPNKIPLIVPHQAEQMLIGTQPHDSHDDSTVSITTPTQDWPKTHLLSNREYSIFIDNDGNGLSSLNGDLSINRYHEHGFDGGFGQYLYIKDEDTDNLWSASINPTRIKPDYFSASFLPHKAEFILQKHAIRSTLEITVSQSDNLEIRALSLKNTSRKRRKLSTTSFFEISLASFAADLAHPAFSKLFIESSWDEEHELLSFRRKPRSSSDTDLIVYHFISSPIVWAPTEYTTNRAFFIGRGGSLARPAGVLANTVLDSSTGFVLDPCASLKQLVDLAPGEEITLSYFTGVAKTIEEALEIAKTHRDEYHIRRAFELAWSYASVELKNQQFSRGLSHAFQELATRIMYNFPSGREVPSALSPLLPQESLWRLGISGDLPIIVMSATESEHSKLFNELVLAHEFLRARGISFDLIVLNDKADGYMQDLSNELEAIIRSSLSSHLHGQPKGIHILNIHHLSDEERTLLLATSRIYLPGERGTLREQLDALKDSPRGFHKPFYRTGDQAFFNDENSPVLGKISQKTLSYELAVSSHSKPPLPWSNVIANDEGGFLVTESGSSFTWFRNSREYRLSPWFNDPVQDPAGEAIYLRDCTSSEYWNPTSGPCFDEATTQVSHGFGKSSFKKKNHGISSELSLSIHPTKPCKIWTLNLNNTSKIERTLEVVFYIDLVLGVSKEKSYRHVRTGVDRKGDFLYATNSWSKEFADNLVFVGSNLSLGDFTCDRTSFIGVGGTSEVPAFLETLKRDRQFELKRLRHEPLSSFFRAGSLLSQEIKNIADPAIVLKYEVVIQPGESKEVLFYAGCSRSIEEARNEAKFFKNASGPSITADTQSNFSEICQPLSISTPSDSFNTMMNGWFLYQTLSCRIKARSGFFQSSGAIGFRDQLQDSLAFLTTSPELTRKQILTNAGRQFEEGDVQHWWHPPSGRGIRSKISDNYMWLPFAVIKYLERTGDTSILEETTPYITGPQLEEHQHDLYFTPEVSSESGTIYDHCMRAVLRSITQVSPRGLPLIGSGDWNDGMNEVGIHGKGESIWLGWFFGSILRDFSSICLARGESENAELLKDNSSKIVQSVEDHGWDGEWYRRAYFDDGTPLGSSDRSECRIDSLAQSWACLTDLGNLDRRKEALQSAYTHLFDAEHQLVRLLWPPLQHETPSAGYIQSYPPGIRENGGQYTHGSSWLIAALAHEDLNDQAFELFNAMNPMNHGNSIQMVKTYQCEPYVTCGDVYSHKDHAGRAGWSWYTGSSGWMYQVGLNYILGLRATAEGLIIKPKVPSDWDNFSIKGSINDLNLSITATRGDENKVTLGKKGYVDFIPWAALEKSKSKAIKVVFS